jgi:radical SAM protein with 4Fe4S-binding SPASM domain
MYDPATYEAEANNPMDLKGLLRILDSMADFERKWQANISHFAVTGGDPLLHPEWSTFLQELKARGKSISMMGNPETLSGENLAILADLELGAFQLSLDGLEETHDYVRAPGSFRRTLEGLQKLKDAGIRAQVMFTLYPENMDQMIPLLKFVASQTAADTFCFDVGSCVGNASNLQKGFGRDAFQDLLRAFLKEKECLEEAGNPILVAEKTHFVNLLRFEQGTFFPFPCDEVPIVGGCAVGWQSPAILSDGTALACRRFPVKVGKLPEQSFEEVFLGSEELKKFRRPQFYAECGQCDFYQHCRGCPAVVFGLTKDPLAAHPLCFRKSIDRAVGGPAWKPKSIPLQTTFREEHDLVASQFSNVAENRHAELLKDRAVQQAILFLAKGRNKLRCFTADPNGYLKKAGLELTDLQKLFVDHILSSFPPESPKHEPFYKALSMVHLIP